MFIITVGYLCFFGIVIVQVNYAVQHSSSEADKYYAVIFSLLYLVLVIICIFIGVSYKKRFLRLTKQVSTVARQTYFIMCIIWWAMIGLRVIIFDLLSFYLFNLVHDERMILAKDIIPIFMAILVRKMGDLFLKR